MTINDRFDRAIQYLYKTNHYLAAEVTKLGYPKMCAGYPPTAGVLWDAERKKIVFLFNEKFEKVIDDIEFAFVVAHEAMHVINGHVFLLKTETDRLKRGHNSDLDIRKFSRKFNKAADCVVNDSLTKLYGLPKVLEEKVDTKPKIYYGVPTVGAECHDMTVMDVFYLLPDPPPQEADDDVENHAWDTFFDKDGSLDEDFVDTFQDFIEGNMENSALSDKEHQKIDEMKDALQKCSDIYARKAGKSLESRRDPIDKLGTEHLNWAKILCQFVDPQKTMDIWNRPNKKLLSVYPDLVVPSWGYTDLQEIFVAIDVSGSISQEAVKLFASVVKNTPKNIKVKAITFNMTCEPYDVRSKTIRSGGGTSFSIIEKYIQAHYKRYPKAVFVLTDGVGDYVMPEHPDRWCWILYGVSEKGFCSRMKTYHIADLLK